MKIFKKNLDALQKTFAEPLNVNTGNGGRIHNSSGFGTRE